MCVCVFVRARVSIKLAMVIASIVILSLKENCKKYKKSKL